MRYNCYCTKLLKLKSQKILRIFSRFPHFSATTTVNGGKPFTCRSNYCTTSSKKTFYSVLGLTQEATPQQIKTAYYTLSKQYHPDSMSKEQNFDQAAIKFLEVGEAYEILGNREKRADYDRQLYLEASRSGAGASPIHRTDDDIARDLRNYQAFRSQWRKGKPQYSYEPKFSGKQYKFDQKDFDKFYNLYKKRQQEEHKGSSWEAKAKADAYRYSASEETTKRRNELYREFHGHDADPSNTNARAVMLMTTLMLALCTVLFIWVESKRTK